MRLVYVAYSGDVFFLSGGISLMAFTRSQYENQTNSVILSLTEYSTNLVTLYIRIGEYLSGSATLDEVMEALQDVAYTEWELRNYMSFWVYMVFDATDPANIFDALFEYMSTHKSDIAQKWVVLNKALTNVQYDPNKPTDGDI